ncbi:MAG: FKBP-type peptidyl-prolyl cis-trans isomerase [Bacteroidales bacterium]|nr:FKBP-type peptidyl-prolyl cis-trans isomerase [Bacteroidales bacterium]
MKKTIKLLALIVLTTTILASCGDGFRKTKSGLEYKFLVQNKGAKQIEVGSIPVGTVKITLNDSLLPSPETAQRFWTVDEPRYAGDVNEGLLMMHVGDKAIFRICADSLYKRGARMPDFYKENAGMILSYEIEITDVVTKAEADEERQNFIEAMREQAAEDDEAIKKYMADNNLKATPETSGLYIIVNKKGKGEPVQIGSTIAVNYTGRLMNGKVFDSSIEKVAKENNILDPSRKYEPFEYQVGATSLIRGWDEGLMNQPAGSSLTLIMPSRLGYGSRENGAIPANSPLIFDIEIVSVK